MEGENNDYSDGLAHSRSRRVKSDKSGRNALLAEMREAKAKGKKLKKVAEEEAVYDTVDEAKYSEIVQHRMEDDWLVDDGEGMGYVEDGREIFDDDEDETRETVQGSKGKRKSTKRHPDIRKPDAPEPGTSKNRDIKAMFLAASTKPAGKKRKEDVSLEGDANLDDLLAELKNESTTKPIKTGSTRSSGVTKKKKKESRSYVEDFNLEPVQTKLPAPKMAPKNKNPFKSDTKPRPQTSVLSKPGHSTKEREAKVSKKSTEPEEVAMDDVDVEEVPSDVSGMMDISDITFDDPMKLEDVVEVKKEAPVVTATWMNDEEEEGTVGKGSDVEESLSSVSIEATAEAGILRFFWMDAYEDIKLQPGVIYLFGKTYSETTCSFVSCCLRVKDLQRQLFFLPRTESVDTTKDMIESTNYTTKDVYNELAAIFPDHRIPTFKCKPAKKEYAFELTDVPDLTEYLEVRYSSSMPALPHDFSGKTFSRVFGSNTSFLENFIMERKLKGPCWLDVKAPEPVNPQFSWCKLDFEVSGSSGITRSADPQPPLPPLTLLSLTVKTVTNHRDNQNEIISVGCLIHKEFYLDRPAPKKLFQEHFAVITHPRDCPLPYDFRTKLPTWGAQYRSVEVEGNERALLGRLLSRLHLLDPDLIVGHDLFGFELDVLLQRLQVHKVAHWHRLGRLKRTGMPKFAGAGRMAWLERAAVAGRVVCDTRIAAKELIRARSYDLSELVRQVLTGQTRVCPGEDLRGLFVNSEGLRQLVDYTLNDAHLVLTLVHELQVLPLGLQITGICGNLLSRTLNGGRSERNEFLLLHAFHERNLLPPDKHFGRFSKAGQQDKVHDDETHEEVVAAGKRKPTYTGGLVLEPKKGFYDRFILLLDFNSLYPSIIQEYNICFTTVERRPAKWTSEAGEELALPDIPEAGLSLGILPTQIRKLVESRREVKKLMQDASASAEQRAHWDIRQRALKITANSMYGCLGFAHSRFYAKHLAALVTYKGREILMKAKELVERMNLEVIYGDTDSIMVNTNTTSYKDARDMGKKIKNEVNKHYRLLEIDIDGVFKSMLLLKKKKYAALMITDVDEKGNLKTKQEMKGLDIVRRDWCGLAVQAGEKVVKEILSGQPREALVEKIHTLMEELGEKVRKEGALSIELFGITKTLTKSPEEYHDRKGQAHVQVALRLNAAGGGGKRLRGGDTVNYVICQDGSGLPHAQRAYSMDEVKAAAGSDRLPVDAHYYLASQLHPVVVRLCEPIEGTDAARIAQCLGLDPSAYARRSAADMGGEGEEADEAAMMGEGERWADCDPIELQCPACNKALVVKESPWLPANASDTGVTSWQCPTCNKPIATGQGITSLTNQIAQWSRRLIMSYYQGWLLCEDPSCAYRCRQPPPIVPSGRGSYRTLARGCPQCHQAQLRLEVPDSRLYKQLAFARHLFSPKLAPGKKQPPSDTQLCEMMVVAVDRFLARSAFSVVDLGKLFAGIRVTGRSQATQH